MKFGPRRTDSPRRQARDGGFTLAEVLAALVFMAIVIPVAVEAMHIAARAGLVAARKTDAALVAQRVLAESFVTTNWMQSSQSGTIAQGRRRYNYDLKSESWAPDSANGMRLLTVTVHYTAQSKDFSVVMSTLVDTTLLNGTNGAR